MDIIVIIETWVQLLSTDFMGYMRKRKHDSGKKWANGIRVHILHFQPDNILQSSEYNMPGKISGHKKWERYK